ncbi:MAG: hypothetical protein JWP27_2205 [Flaviaesturariibacter sp.]|nr:hypothetical protein [Flaviaesturariibacter sp.]
MSFFEWLGESMNPGPLGTVHSARHKPVFPPGMKRGRVLLLAVVGWTLLVYGLNTIYHLEEDRWQWALGFAVYLAIAALITPAPDARNMGFAGGLIDHPFRITDDYNRLLAFLLVFLVPGKIIIFAVAATVRLARQKLSP